MTPGFSLLQFQLLEGEEDDVQGRVEVNDGVQYCESQIRVQTFTPRSMVEGRVLEGAFDMALSTLPTTIALWSHGLKMASSRSPFNFSCYPFSPVVGPSGVNKSQIVSIGVASSPKGVVSSEVKPNQELEGSSFHSLSQNNPSDSFSPVRCLPVESSLPQMEDFRIEGISPSKLASIKSLLGSMSVKIVKYNENGVQLAKNNGCFGVKVYSRKKKSFSFSVLRRF